MPSRPPLDPLPSSSSSSTIPLAHTPSQLPLLFAQLTFFVVPAKLESTLGQIYDRIEELGGRCVSLEDARVVVTALQGRPRLGRALGRFVDTKTVLSVEYINDTYTRCLESIASSSSSALPKLPPRDPYLVRGTKRARSASPSSDASLAQSLTSKRGSGATVQDEADDMELYPEDIRLRDIPRLAVERPSPLICPNQDIIDAIKPIYLEREFEEREQKNSNVLSYRRSMSILKSVPRRITSGKEALKLADVGDKVAQRIDEFLTTGHIQESESILASKRYQALNEFSSVFTVGAHTAVQLWDAGCRTLGDVRRHYAGVDGEAGMGVHGVGGRRAEREKVRRREEGGMTRVEIVEEWLMLKDELAQRIPRSEVEEIADCVRENLDALVPGCEYTICGGYRRGKDESNDVDIVFRTPEEGQDVGLLRALYLRLSALGIITHVLHVTARDPLAPIHASANNFDNLDKSFVIFRLPSSSTDLTRIHRRVDLICAPRERYAAAVLSWSGSMMFERDLRRYAEERGYKFRAGLVNGQTLEEVNFETEREIFKHLGLRYVPPTLRNADG